jgi:colanic acid/amylovoran biosynthesis glycosyltransferase
MAISYGSEPPIGHVVAEYLPRSATFIYTLLRFQRGFRPVVLAGRTANLAEFPIASVVELSPPEAPAPRRIARRLTAHAAGCRTTDAHRIWSEAARLRCVCLHAHFGPVGYECLTARRRLDVPLVTTFYGRDLSLPVGDRRWQRRYARLFAEGTGFVCEGPAMARRLGELGCPMEKVRVIRIGVDLADFPFTPRTRGRPLVLLQAARFVEKKGIDLSIRAFAAARREFGESELWLVGDGPERARLETLVSSLGLTGAVRFLGMVSHARWREVMRKAHIGIQPSRTAQDGDTEGGAPTVLLEMQAAGMPVVATRHADIPWVVPEPERLAPEEDVDALARELVELAGASDAEWRGRAERGRAHVEREHGAQAVAERHERIYRELAGTPGANWPRGAKTGAPEVVHA